ncbi:MAG: RHS repeat-associated core domain-containing protein [Kiritimatiellia bacterium]
MINRTVISCLVYMLVIFQFPAQAEDCANCDPCEGLTGEELDCCEQQQGGGGNPFNIFSANVRRKVTDLELAVQVGERPLEFTRTQTSRPEWAARPRGDYPFGQTGNWRHSYQWTVLDDGLTTNGDQKIQVIDPTSMSSFYYKKSTNDLHMTSTPRAHARVLPEGTNYYLFYLDGTRYHITERVVDSDKLFRMEGFSDPYSNRYQFVYNTNDLITDVLGPNTNHFIHLEYSSVSNSVDAGLVRFTYVNTNAAAVLLPATWNDWQANQTPMTLSNGAWIADVNLDNGFYEYRFLVRYPGDTNDYWITDPDNTIYGGPSSNSVAVVDPFRLVSSVEASDGRSVNYVYDWAWSASKVLDIQLVEANYGDGTKAEYSYYPASYDQDREGLLRTADDPNLNGPGRAVQYSYHTNRDFSGQIYEERTLISSQLLGRLEFDPTDSNVRIYTAPGGEISTYNYLDSNCNLLARTNALGYVYQNEYYGGNGMLWKRVDPMGRTSVYNRTWHFGAILSISNSAGGCGCECGLDVINAYTDETYPFYIASTTDKGGRTTTYTRDGSHRPTRIDHPDGTYETFSYNDFGQVLSNRMRDGSVWTSEYDQRGLKLSETDPLGAVTHFSYDEHDRLAALSNDLGYVTQYFYDWRGNVTNTIYPDGTEEALRYDKYAQATQLLHRAGGGTSIAYDELGFRHSVTDPLGATSLYNYNVEGRLLSQTTPLGLTVSNSYDVLGRKLSETYSSDNTSRLWKYDPDGVRTQVNRLGAETHIDYDAWGRKASVVDEEGRITSFGYDEVGNRTHVTNALGDVTTFLYDAANRLVSVQKCSGETISNVYDGVGRLIRTIDANGIVLSNTYDTAGNEITVHRGGLLVASNGYNSLGWAVARRDSAGLLITNTFDSIGRLLRSYMPDGTYSENIYENTYLKAASDRAGRSTTYYRDLLGRITNQIDNAGHSVLFSYDSAGHLTNLTDQAGNITRFVYDEEGRLRSKIHDDATSYTYSYNAEGLLTLKTDANGIATTYEYDDVGNLILIDYATDADVTFAYDALSRMTNMVDAIGTTVYSYEQSCSAVSAVDGPFNGDLVSYSYDDGAQLTNITLGSHAVDYVYDTLGRISGVIAPEGNYSFGYNSNGTQISDLIRANGSISEYTYDPLNRLTNLLNRTSVGQLISSFAYTLDDSDQRIRIARTDQDIGGGLGAARIVDCTYDAVGQLTGASCDSPGYDFNYGYDATGNPTNQARNGFVTANAFNNLNQSITSHWSGTMTVLGVANLTNGAITVNGLAAARSADGIYVVTNLPVTEGANVYTALLTDVFGRTATNAVGVMVGNRGYGYDANGNMTNDSEFAYTYDEADRLIEVRLAQTGALIVKNRYDGRGRRRERILYADGGSTNRYVYHDWLVVAVLDGADNQLEAYTHGPDISGTIGGAGGIGGILSVISAQPSAVNHFHYDGNGNVINLNDTNEVLTVSYTYSPFGQVLAQRGSVSSRYQFSSKEYDVPVRLNYYVQRFYSPQMGQWPNRDPIEEEGGYNLYQFCANNPVNYWDELGSKVCCGQELEDAKLDCKLSELKLGAAILSATLACTPPSVLVPTWGALGCSVAVHMVAWASYDVKVSCSQCENQ